MGFHLVDWCCLYFDLELGIIIKNFGDFCLLFFMACDYVWALLHDDFKIKEDDVSSYVGNMQNLYDFYGFMWRFLFTIRNFMLFFNCFS